MALGFTNGNRLLCCSNSIRAKDLSVRETTEVDLVEHAYYEINCNVCEGSPYMHCAGCGTLICDDGDCIVAHDKVCEAEDK